MKIATLAILLALLSACAPTKPVPPTPAPIACEPYHRPTGQPNDPTQAEWFRENSNRVTSGPETHVQIWVCQYCEQIVGVEILGATETNLYFQASVKRPR